MISGIVSAVYYEDNVYLNTITLYLSNPLESR